MAERERLARAVHDGVLQVLGLVRRRGAELGGAAGGARRARGGAGGRPAHAADHRARRRATPTGRRDLAAALRMLAFAAGVTVATPAHPVELPAHAVDELVAAVGAALANVDVHVGPDAPAWVLLEDLGAPSRSACATRARASPRAGWPPRRPRAGWGWRGRCAGACATSAARSTSTPGPGRGTEWIIAGGAVTGDGRQGWRGTASPSWSSTTTRSGARAWRATSPSAGSRVVATAPDADAAVRIAARHPPAGRAHGPQPRRDVGRDGDRGHPSSGCPTRRSWCSRPAASTPTCSTRSRPGPRGYLVKSAGAEELLAAVRRTADGLPGVHPRSGGAGAGRVPPARRRAERPAARRRCSPSARPRCCGSSPRA